MLHRKSVWRSSLFDGSCLQPQGHWVCSWKLLWLSDKSFCYTQNRFLVCLAGMKHSLNPAQRQAGGSTLAVRMAGEQETQWFDGQLSQHHYLGSGRVVGDYLRQIVELAARCPQGPPFYRYPTRTRTSGPPAPARLPHRTDGRRLPLRQKPDYRAQLPHR